MSNKLKPSNFLNYPWTSVFEKAEAEIVALNIMRILSRTGDIFRRLSWREYKLERLKDRDFDDIEKLYFNKVIDYTTSAKSAFKFSKEWQ